MIERPNYPPINDGYTSAARTKTWMNETVDLQRRFQKLMGVAWGLDIAGNGSGLMAFGSAPNDTFKLEATDPESMSVNVGAGLGFLNFVPIVKDEVEQSDAMVAPVADDRIDCVCVNVDTGAIVFVTGEEASSPVAPSVTNELYLKIGEIYHRPGESAIYDTDTVGEGYIYSKETPFNV